MISVRTSNALRWVAPVFLAALATSGVQAQRVVLPEGSVIVVRTMTALESATARQGQTFETTVADAVGADNYTVIPAGSRIRGVVTFAQPADRQRSGVIEVSFDRLILPGGATFPMRGKLTSTDAAERRQIDADPNARVVLVGGRGGIGATIAGAGSENSPATGILAALGSLLSQARDVRVPAGTALAVQLEQELVLTRRGAARPTDASTLYTAPDRIRAAQQALARQNYYRGAITGQLDDATQRALFEFQVDRGIVGTGNLDGRTAAALGISAGDVSGAGGGAVLSAENASLVRRGAQALVGRYRQDLLVSPTGRLDARRTYGPDEVELWFALSAFADNSSLYEQLVRAAEISARSTQPVQSAWSSLRSQLATLDAA